MKPHIPDVLLRKVREILDEFDTRRDFFVGFEDLMPTILVVDDDHQIRVWVRRILESKGYQVEEAGDGKEALAYLERAEPVLILLDIFMPNVDGLEVLLHLRLCAKPSKILVLSGNPINGFDVCRTAKVFGAHDIIVKPFSAQGLLQRIESLLSTA
ncbi:MAG: response regulator [Nitrospira sp. BO4]|jgi:DNA-binding response OmpR family regulator|nr:response regulator [Nitrospira sp. BO4]